MSSEEAQARTFGVASIALDLIWDQAKRRQAQPEAIEVP